MPHAIFCPPRVADEGDVRDLMAFLTLGNAVVAGVVATIALDLVAGMGTALHLFRIPAFGRWGLYALRGTFTHEDIDRSPRLKGENALTFPFHYVAGVVLVAPYLVLLDFLSLGSGNLLLATLYGLVTSLIPFFVMLPSMGYGLFGLRHRRDTFWLREILAMHLGYGIGIGLAVQFLIA